MKKTKRHLLLSILAIFGLLATSSFISSNRLASFVYAAAPDLPVLAAPLNGDTTPLLNPTLSVTYTDADTDAGTVEVKVSNIDANDCLTTGTPVFSGTSASTPSGRNAFVTVSTDLTDGVAYFWCARSHDGVSYSNGGAYTSMGSFTVDFSDKLVYATYLGGADHDHLEMIDRDTSGNIVLAGWGSSSDLPTTAGVYQETDPYPGWQSTNYDLFVAKLTSDGTTITWMTYVAGDNDDRLSDMLLDADGNVYISGNTRSSNFPTTNGFDTVIDTSNGDGFLTKLNSSGTSVLYSTVVGGSDDWDHVYDIAHISGGEIGLLVDSYATADVPTTSGAYDETVTQAGDEHAMYVQVDTALTGAASLVYGTVIESVNSDLLYASGKALHINSSGKVYIALTSEGAGLTTTANAVQAAYGGGFTDIFVIILDPQGNGAADLEYASYLGGSDQSENPMWIYSDEDTGYVYLSGRTTSTTYPITSGAYDETAPASQNWIISIIDPSVAGINGLIYSTYLGGADSETAASFALNDDDKIIVLGTTRSADYPIVGASAYDATPTGGDSSNGSGSLALSVISPDGNGSDDLAFSSFLWAASNASGVTFDYVVGGNMYIATSVWEQDTIFAETPITENALQKEFRRDGTVTFTNDGMLMIVETPSVITSGSTPPPSQSGFVPNETVLAPFAVNDVVWTSLVHDDVLYVAGDFQYIGEGQGNFTILNSADGTPFPSTDVSDANDTVSRVIPDGNGGWYISGNFSFIDGESRDLIARIQSDGSLDPDFIVDTGSVFVRVMVLDGSTLYLVGNFSEINGVARNRVAAVNAATGELLPWNPNLSGGNINALAVDDTVVYVGGSFTAADTIGGANRNRLAALDKITALATSWNPNVTNGSVEALAFDNNNVYVGGSFTTAGTIGGAARNRIAAVDKGTGSATSWNPGSTSTVSGLIIDGTDLFARFTGTATIGGASRSNVAKLNASSDTADSWNAAISGGSVSSFFLDGNTIYLGGSFTSAGGSSRLRAAAVDADTAAATAFNPPQFRSEFDPIISAIAAQGSDVFVGGEFRLIGGTPRRSIAAFDTDLNLLPWDPFADLSFDDLGLISSMAVVGDTLYLGGAFYWENPLDFNDYRLNALAIDIPSQTVLPWDPQIDDFVWGMDAAGSTIYVAGDFEQAGGASRNSVAAIDANTGLATAWNPDVTNPADDFDRRVWTIKVDQENNLVFIGGGNFSHIGGSTTAGGELVHNLAAIDLNTGVAVQGFNADNHVRNLVLRDENMVALGYFSNVLGASRLGYAEFSGTTLTSVAHDINHSGDAGLYDNGDLYVVGGFTEVNSETHEGGVLIHEDDTLNDWNPGVSVGFLEVYTVARIGDYLMLGGDFLEVQGVFTPGLVFFSGSYGGGGGGGGPVPSQNGGSPAQIFQQLVAPSNVASEALNTEEIEFTWGYQGSNHSGFRIYNEQGTLIEQIANPHARSFVLGNLLSNQKVEGYKIKAFNTFMESQSVLVPAAYTLLPNASPRLITRTGETLKVGVNEELGALNKENSGVQFELSEAGKTVRQTEWLKMPEYQFIGLNPQNALSVKVRVRNGDGVESEWSLPLNFQPLVTDQVAFAVDLQIIDENGQAIINPVPLEKTYAVVLTAQNTAKSLVAEDVLISVVLPEFVRSVQGSTHSNPQGTLNDNGVGENRGVTAFFDVLEPGASVTFGFTIGFDIEALQSFVQSAAVGGPVISLVGSVTTTSSSEAYQSNQVNIQPDIESLLAREIVDSPELPLPTPEETDQIDNLIDELIREENEDSGLFERLVEQEQRRSTQVSQDGNSFTVDVTQTSQEGDDMLLLTGVSRVEGEQIFFSGTSNKPASVVTLFFNELVLVTAVSDSEGFWQTHVSAQELGIAPGETRSVRVEAVVAKDDLRSDRVEVGRISVMRATEQEIVPEFETVVSSSELVTAIKTVTKEVQRVVEEREVEIQQTLTVAAPVVVISSAPLWGYLPYLPTLLYHFITYLVGLIGRRKKGQQRFFGIAYDAITKDPLALAIIRLYKKDGESERLVSTFVTDKQGKYDALLEPGSYRIEVKKPQYTFPSSILSGISQDGQYDHVYQGGIEITDQTTELIVPDLPMDPVNMEQKWQTANVFKKIWLSFQKAGHFLALPLLFVGSLASVVVVAAVPENPINWILSVAYVLMFLLQLKLRQKPEKAWGIVYDIATNAPLPLVNLQLIDPAFGKVVASRLSDYQGRFRFAPEPGTYIIKTEKEGFVVADVIEEQRDHRLIKGELKIKEKGQTIGGDIAMRRTDGHHGII